MMNRAKARQPSAALVISVVALFVALGAGAYAVTKAPKNSVVSRSIKNKQVKGPDFARATTVTGATFQGLPTDPSGTSTRPPIGPSAESDYDENHAPFDMVVSDFRAETAVGAGQSRSFILQRYDGTPPIENVLSCVVQSPDLSCTSNGSGIIRKGSMFRLLITNGGTGAGPIGTVSYSLRPK